MIKINKMNKKLKISVIVIVIIVAIFGGVFAGGKMFIASKVSKIKTVNIPKTPEEIGIDNNKFKAAEGQVKTAEVPPPNGDTITNILLLGIDSRDPKNDPGRSDSIMILTIDEKNNKIKATSIMRDSLVNIDGHGQEKITHAHVYGGPLLSLKTVNQNYNMDIMNYVQVDFFGLAKVIDYVGGVDINVTADEIPVANEYIKEVAEIENKTPTLLTNSGLLTINGSQAVAYARIRYVGHDDFQRTERQRTVLSALFKKLITKNITEIPAVADALLPCLETSLNTNQITDIAKYILIHRMTSIEQSRVPYDDLYKDEIVNKMDVLTWDRQPTIDRMHEFIFGSKSN